MSNYLKIRRGLDLNLSGSLEEPAEVESIETASVGLTPDDFHGISPKLEVKEGDEIEEGEAVAHDKRHEGIKICSPVGGTVKKIARGERRKILEIVIEANKGSGKRKFDLGNIRNKEDIRNLLLESGLWAYMRQLPFGIVPNPETEPRDIFVTAFDSAPLSGDMLKQPGVNEKNINAGLKLLSTQTEGKIYVSTREGFPFELTDGEHVIVDGPHPSGLASIQSGNIKPVNKGETVWLLDIVTLSKMGELWLTGSYGHSTMVAITGSEIEKPHYALTTEGAKISELLARAISGHDKHVRIISGNVLSGWKTGEDGYLRFPYWQITVIPEGDDKDEFMGWASMAPSKLSVSRSFPMSRFRRIFSPDARLNGGRRAMIMSGLYEKMIPLDIMPEHLIKAILSKNIERMEQLGIYEVSPEDFALAEFVDPSKLELQKIVREGLDYLRKETE